MEEDYNELKEILDKTTIRHMETVTFGEVDHLILLCPENTRVAR